MSSPWFCPAGSTARDGFDIALSPGSVGGTWQHTGLWAADLAAGDSRTVETGDCEWLVLPISGGSWLVSVDGQPTVTLRGRLDVWAGPTDLAYVPRDASVTVTAVEGGRVALPHARARTAYAPAVIRAEEVQVELRGSGSCSRQVHNFATPAVLQADSIIACEVYTPSGNWSSYPPHKHDEHRPGLESELEEIYAFRLRAAVGAPAGAAAFGYQRVYGTADRPIEVLEEVRTDDVVLVPHGWHGPAMAPAGYDMYYLNVMAGPGPERAWLICDDPAHAWVRDTWAHHPVDPRLPLGGLP